jgi:hypothetical protein
LKLRWVAIVIIILLDLKNFILWQLFGLLLKFISTRFNELNIQQVLMKKGVLIAAVDPNEMLSIFSRRSILLVYSVKFPNVV